jgi:hypothetical protein
MVTSEKREGSEGMERLRIRAGHIRHQQMAVEVEVTRLESTRLRDAFLLKSI